MTDTNYYDLLEVARDADTNDIKTAKLGEAKDALLEKKKLEEKARGNEANGGSTGGRGRGGWEGNFCSVTCMSHSFITHSSRSFFSMRLIV